MVTPFVANLTERTVGGTTNTRPHSRFEPRLRPWSGYECRWPWQNDERENDDLLSTAIRIPSALPDRRVFVGN
jgi:hypothetical protein